MEATECDEERLFAEALRRTKMAEFERRVALALAELDGEELENVSALIGWFQRRYPIPKERLAYSRRRYESWRRAASYAAARSE